MAVDDYLLLKITPEDIRAGNLDAAEDLLAILCADDDTIREQEGKLLFDIDDLYDTWPDPAMVGEVREWFKQVDARWPHLPYFLGRDGDSSQVPMYTSLLVPFQMEGDSMRFNRHRLELFAIEKIRAVHAFSAEHELDPREMVRQFCEQLHLDVIEEVVNAPADYPFDPERITSPFLQEFFNTGYYFHTIDASDEAVLYALVEDPIAVYYADMALSVDLFKADQYPVISMELTIFDVPEEPLKMTFVYNIDLERHRNELYAYGEMSFLMCNVLFNVDGELHYGFTRAIELPDELRERMRSLVLDASNLLRAIPKEARDFPHAVEKLFAAKGVVPDKPLEKAVESVQVGPAAGLQMEFPKFSMADGDTAAETDSDAEPGEEPDILEEISLDSDDDAPEGSGDHVADQRRVLRSPYESSIPISVLPESIQRITKALSKPVRRAQTNVSDQLAITPAPKKVVARDEDPVERMSRRLLIMQNNVERIERENMRLQQELKAGREEIERLQRENMELESRWWKFWK